MLMHKVLFVDRDGTINKEVDGDNVNPLERKAVLQSSIDGLTLVPRDKYKIMIVTNQGGIESGKLSWEMYHLTNAQMFRQFAEHGIVIDDIFCCPHTEQTNCKCRKPKPGMIHQALVKYEIDLPNSYVIGDRPTDVQLGNNVGCKTIYIENLRFPINGEVTPDYVAKHLLDAVQFILREEG
jgi:D-glycero-D-manno-heptose 1,7-bisphosphate phosphatase